MQNQKSAIGLDGNITALIGYIIGIIALVEIFIEKDNKFVRFHAIQAVLFHVVFWISFTVVWIVGAIVVFAISAASTGLGWILGLLLTLILLAVFFGGLIGLIYAAMKAYQGVTFKLPIVGNMAEKWA
jgi:uncharacterized membrane protein